MHRVLQVGRALRTLFANLALKAQNSGQVMLQVVRGTASVLTCAWPARLLFDPPLLLSICVCLPAAKVGVNVSYSRGMDIVGEIHYDWPLESTLEVREQPLADDLGTSMSIVLVSGLLLSGGSSCNWMFAV